MRPERIIEVSEILIDLEMVGAVDRVTLGDKREYYFTIYIVGLKERIISHNSQYNPTQCTEMRNFFINKWKAFKEWQTMLPHERVAEILINGTDNGTN